MAFEAFLDDERARPARRRFIGHAVSFLLHAPPAVAFFVYAATQSHVIGTAGVIPEMAHRRGGYFVPMLMWHSSFLSGGVAAAPGPEKAMRDPLRHGLPLRQRRPALRQPTAIGPIPPFEAPAEPVEYEPPGLDDVELDALLEDGVEGILEGAAQGAVPSGGNPIVVPKPKPEPVVRGPAAGSSGNSHEAGVGPGDGPGMNGPGGAIVTGRDSPPSYIPSELATHFRTYEHFPSLPESFWPPGEITCPFLAEVCVGTDGSVATVAIKEGATEEADGIVNRAIRSWRYRPRLVGGVPRPFCHPIRIVYSRATPKFGGATPKFGG